MNKVNQDRGTNNLIEANTRLFDENKWLRADNERLERIINEFDKWLLGEQMMIYRGSDCESLIRLVETKNKWLELSRIVYGK